VPSARELASEVELPSDEAQHLTRVLRLKAGDSLAVFNGNGGAYSLGSVELSGCRSK